MKKQCKTRIRMRLIRKVLLVRDAHSIPTIAPIGESPIAQVIYIKCPVSLTEKIIGYEPVDVGSIPARGAKMVR